MTAALTLPGVQCPCGGTDLVVVLPGDDGRRHPVLGRLTRPVAARGFCCVEHAREAGWPWLASQARGKRRGRAA